jgi:hypothetical protein
MNFKALFRIILINISVFEKKERIVYNYLFFKIL